MKKNQLITIVIGMLLTAAIYFFVKTTPRKKAILSVDQHAPGDGHEHETVVSIDSVLALAKKQLSPDQAMQISRLEYSISKGAVKEQQLHVYHQLVRFWADSAKMFEPYAWYQAEAARLENSEKSLNFAARLFLDNLQTGEQSPGWIKWKALQAKDLFERSLKINPANDSVKVELGATYLFGGISATPMEGILKIREVAEKDSSNMYAQLMLGKGSLLSGQYDKAIDRFLRVCQFEPANLEAALLLAEAYERTGDKKNAATWYQKSLTMVKRTEMRKAIQDRLTELTK